MKTEYRLASDDNHALAREVRSPIRSRYVAHPLSLGMICTFLMSLSGCGLGAADPEPAGLAQEGAGLAHAAAIPSTWQPFTKDSVWNLQLPAQRQETPLPAAGLAVANMAVNDDAYGIKLYFASASDPTWSIDFSDYNSVTDDWSPPNPTTLRAPAGMVPPSGSDGTIIVVDENQQYVYEMWQCSISQTAAGGAPHASCSSINISDVRSSGIHRNVGVTAAGLPGVGGLLRSSDLASGTAIRHKLWLALNSELLNGTEVWPAQQLDSTSKGTYAALAFGDVVALTQGYSVANGKCKLSPVMQRLAHALQDFGGIVQDRGGDSVGITAEVGALSTHLDISQSALWSQLSCLRQYLVKVNGPWTGATAGGLGY